MKYPEKYRDGYVKAALAADDLPAAALAAGYKHFYNALADLFSGLAETDIPLMLCATNKVAKIVKQINPDAEELAAKLEKAIDHDVNYMVLPMSALPDNMK